MRLYHRTRWKGSFTLIELLVVIVIIALLASFAFPVFQAVQIRAKKLQAKNDLTQIVTAVNAYYTEYGKYPIDIPAGGTPVDVIFDSTNNDKLFDVLTNNTASITTAANGTNLVTFLNPRQITFISPHGVKDGANPRSGIATQAATVNGVSIRIGEFVDPWGGPYVVAIDGDYSGLVQVGTVGTALNYSDLTYATDTGGAAAIRGGVVAGSYGMDGTKGTKSPASSNFKNSDDVISWQ
jgi:prepilin-type N-terminal cleavage/methylation domain-containing protein